MLHRYEHASRHAADETHRVQAGWTHLGRYFIGPNTIGARLSHYWALEILAGILRIVWVF